MFSILGAGIFITIWWTTIFAVLPFGIRTQRESGSVVPGSEPGAPARVHLGRISLITTAISIPLWLLVYATIEYQWIDMDRWTNTLLGLAK